MAHIQHDIPESVIEIAQLLTDLEIAFRGKDAAPEVKEAFSFTIEPYGKDGYMLTNYNESLFQSTDWIDEQSVSKILPLLREVSSHNRHLYIVKPEHLDVIKAVFAAKMDDLKIEHADLAKEELKKKLIEAFNKDMEELSFLKELGLREILPAERAPRDCFREAAIVIQWRHPQAPGKDQYINKADPNRILSREDRIEIIQARAAHFIEIRSLQNTMEEYGPR